MCEPAENACMHVWHNMSSHGTSAVVVDAGADLLGRRMVAGAEPLGHTPTQPTAPLAHQERGSPQFTALEWGPLQDCESFVQSSDFSTDLLEKTTRVGRYRQ